MTQKIAVQIARARTELRYALAKCNVLAAEHWRHEIDRLCYELRQQHKPVNRLAHYFAGAGI